MKNRRINNFIGHGESFPIITGVCYFFKNPSDAKS